MNKRNIVIFASLLLLSACAAQPAVASGADISGFLTGLWHGWCAVFALIGHIFDNSIRIYDTPNNGGWYDFGFLIGVGAFSTGCSSCSRS